jgi:hypothetical protein
LLIVSTVSPPHKYQNTTFVFFTGSFVGVAVPVVELGLEHPAKDVDKVAITSAHASIFLKLNFTLIMPPFYFYGNLLPYYHFI